MADRCIIFLHIPKTGGVTLGNALKLKYPPSHVLRLQTLTRPLHDIENAPLNKRRDARVVMGHLHYGVHRYMPQDCEYITFLRNPVERVLSIFRYVKRDPRHWLHEERRTGMGLREFVETSSDPGEDHHRDRLLVDNHQTRLLAGIGSGASLTEQETPDMHPDALDEAKRNLKKFLVVGVTERFDESFILMRRALGWRLPLYVTSNVSPRGGADGSVPPLSDDDYRAIVELIRERNQLDLELYDFARELHSAAVRQQGASLRREVAAFKAFNFIPNKIVPPAEGLIRRLLPSRFPGK